MKPETVVVLGLASLLGDGLSLGAADFMATKTDAQYMEEEEARELK